MIMFQIIFSIIMVGYIRPYSDPHAWKHQIGNEFLLLLVYYHMMCFTPFFPDFEKQFILGYSCVACVAGHLLWTMSYIIFFSFKQMSKEYRLWSLRRKLSASLGKRKGEYYAYKYNRKINREEHAKRLEEMPVIVIVEDSEVKKKQLSKNKGIKRVKLVQLS